MTHSERPNEFLESQLGQLTYRELAILELVCYYSGITAPQLAKRMNLSDHHARRLGKELVHQGFMTFTRESGSLTYHFYLVHGVRLKKIIEAMDQRQPSGAEPAMTIAADEAEAVMEAIELSFVSLARRAREARYRIQSRRRTRKKPRTKDGG